MKRISLLIVAGLMLASCSTPRATNPAASSTSSGSPSPTSSASVSPSPTASAKASPSHSPGHDGPEPGSVTAKYSEKSPPSDGFRPADSGDSTTGSGRLPLEMRTKPGCGEVGGSIEVTLRTKPNVQVGILSNVPREDGTLADVRGRSGPDGLYTWRMPLPSRMQPGNYDVMGAAADDHGQDGGRSGTWLVVVAGPGGCP